MSDHPMWTGAILVVSLCLAVTAALRTATAGPTPGGSDSDSDGVENVFDNCLQRENPDQKDIDHDGCGDRCDCDFDQNGPCGLVEFGMLKGAFGSSVGEPQYNATVDMDCNGAIGISDFALYKLEFHTYAGPSGLVSSLRDPVTCP